MNINKNIKLTEDQHNEINEFVYQYTNAMTLSQAIPQNSVTFYGGAKLGNETQCYKDIFELAKEFGNRNWAVITGGGPGVMEAGIAGVQSVQGTGIGFRLRLEGETPNVIGDIDFMFEHFPPRKYALRQSDVYVYCPGSVGTLDELMENLDLMKTDKMPKKPIYLYDSSYWKGLTDWIESVIIDKWKLGASDLKNLYKLVDSPAEIIADLFPSNE
jgi:uncharacterized protein (TIGR00730 family)